MGFTIQLFIFVFFPLFFLGYYGLEWSKTWGSIGRFLNRIRLQDVFVVCCSLVFYTWALLDNLLFLVLFMIAVYLCAILLHYVKKNKPWCFSLHREENGQVVQTKGYRYGFLFALMIAGLLLLLVHYKYVDFLNELWLSWFQKPLSNKEILAPLGISFLTFSAISYLADVYRGKATPGNFLDCAMYLTFFPKVVSGPIVLWQNFQPQMTARKIDTQCIARGIHQIIIGLIQKVLLADVFGQVIAQVGTSHVDQITAIGAVLLYFLQIYYDFAGYSHIAIGLANMMGFSFAPNFHFPYRSTSISEFWRRWHISLGAWFREYVYFPLGGSRVSKAKTLRNLAIVFALTGIWHGAGWNYILWGGINAAAVVVERLIHNKKFYQKIPTAVKYVATMLVVMLFWQLFRFPKIQMAADWFRLMLGQITETVVCTWQYYFTPRIIATTVIGLLGATVLGSPKIVGAYQKLAAKPVAYVVQEVVLLGLLFLSLVFMVNSTYSPFIYFQY